MTYLAIKKLADLLHDELKPFCDRIMIAGSIRRESKFPRDIEILCIPKVQEQPTLFPGPGSQNHWEYRSEGFIKVVDRMETISGDARAGKYMKRKARSQHYFGLSHEDTQVDIFTACKENWGLQLAIRTGSAEYSHKVLATGWSKAGYYSDNGYLHKSSDGSIVPILEEHDLFSLIGEKYTEPQAREFYC